MEFSRYEQVPAHIASKVIEVAKAAKFEGSDLFFHHFGF
jgi:hypothetical protein